MKSWWYSAKTYSFATKNPSCGATGHIACDEFRVKKWLCRKMVWLSFRPSFFGHLNIFWIYFSETCGDELDLRLFIVYPILRQPVCHACLSFTVDPSLCLNFLLHQIDHYENVAGLKVLCQSTSKAWNRLPHLVGIGLQTNAIVAFVWPNWAPIDHTSWSSTLGGPRIYPK